MSAASNTKVGPRGRCRRSRAYRQALRIAVARDERQRRGRGLAAGNARRCSDVLVHSIRTAVADPDRASVCWVDRDPGGQLVRRVDGPTPRKTTCKRVLEYFIRGAIINGPKRCSICDYVCDRRISRSTTARINRCCSPDNFDSAIANCSSQWL
jgi:hypothetical protein